MAKKKVQKKFNLKSLAFWRRGRRRAEPDLNKVWLYILASFVLIGAIILTLHFYLFVKISGNEIFLPAVREKPTVETIDRTELQNTLDFFEERERNFNNLRHNRPATVDPAVRF